MNKKLLVCAILATTSSQVHAFKFDTPRDWQIRWDNTLRASLMSRVEKQDPSVYDPTKSKGPDGPSPNAAYIADDATFSVDRSDGGLVSARFDLRSEVDVSWRETLGFRISGAGWYDFAYDDSDHPKNGTTASGLNAYDTWGQLSVHPGEYNDETEDLHFRGGELLDAFVFANFDIGDVSANIRAGRHVLYWGQSLLSIGAIHGFAGSMAALDLARGFGNPGSEAKELFLPNSKASTVVQLTDNLTLNAFYAFEFVPLRWAEGGSYFSLNEVLTENSEFLTIFAGEGGLDGTARSGLKAVDYKSKDSGDWGVNLQYYIEPWALETSFIYMNNTDRLTSGLYGSASGVTDDDRALASKTNANLLGTYGWVYKEDIDTFGISLSKEILDISWGADFVYRKNNALNPDLTASVFGALLGQSPTVDPGNNYPGPTGDTMHVVLNGLGLLNGDWGLWDGGRYVVEATFSKLDDFGDFEEKANPFIHKGRWTSHIGVLFRPTWYQVRPGWDLTLPMSVSYAIDGEQTPNSAGGNEEVGNGAIGAELLINETWIVEGRYNLYYGPQGNGTAAFIKDRDNVTFSVKRTF